MTKNTILMSLSLVLVATSCVTMKPEAEDPPRPEMSYQNELLTAVLKCQNSHWATLQVDNKTDKAITLVWDLSSFTPRNGNSQRLVPSRTKYSKTETSIPPITIAPNSNYKGSLSSYESMYYQSGQYGKWRESPWIPKDLKNTKFLICYRIGQSEDFITFDGNESSAKMLELPKVVGSVRYDEKLWNVVFSNSKKKRRNYLFNKAIEIAKSKYGEDAELVNVEYKGKWSPLSIVLLFDALGFVEDASITADVLSKQQL